MDPEELLSCVRSSLVKFGLLDEVRVRGLASGMLDNLRLILPGEEATLKRGDVSNVGIDISTSSFGRSAIHVSPMVCASSARTGYGLQNAGVSCRSDTSGTPTASVRPSVKPSPAP